MINSENGQLRSLVQLNVRGRDMGTFVDEARQALHARLQLPAGYSLQFSGQYEDQIHARKRPPEGWTFRFAVESPEGPALLDPLLAQFAGERAGFELVRPI